MHFLQASASRSLYGVYNYWPPHRFSPGFSPPIITSAVHCRCPPLSHFVPSLVTPPWTQYLTMIVLTVQYSLDSNSCSMRTKKTVARATGAARDGAWFPSLRSSLNTKRCERGHKGKITSRHLNFSPRHRRRFCVNSAARLLLLSLLFDHSPMYLPVHLFWCLYRCRPRLSRRWKLSFGKSRSEASMSTRSWSWFRSSSRLQTLQGALLLALTEHSAEVPAHLPTMPDGQPRVVFIFHTATFIESLASSAPDHPQVRVLAGTGTALGPSTRGSPMLITTCLTTSSQRVTLSILFPTSSVCR